MARLVKSAAAGLIVLVITAVAATLGAQTGSPNPYREDAGWAKLPADAKCQFSGISRAVCQTFRRQICK